MLISALHVRCLAWWRYEQARHNNRLNGVHPKRFKVWRWESQLTEHYGEEESRDAFANVGWMLRAQDRDKWKSSLAGFLEDTVGR